MWSRPTAQVLPRLHKSSDHTSLNWICTLNEPSGGAVNVFVCADSGWHEIMLMLPDKVTADTSMIHLAYENIQSPKRTVGIYVNMCCTDAGMKRKMSVWWYTFTTKCVRMQIAMRHRYHKLLNWLQYKEYKMYKHHEISLRVCARHIFVISSRCTQEVSHLLPWCIREFRTAVHTAWDLAYQTRETLSRCLQDLLNLVCICCIPGRSWDLIGR